MSDPSATWLRQATHMQHRANPYPLYCRFLERPVVPQEDGRHVVSRYQDIAALLHDPRLSSAERQAPDGTTDQPTFSEAEAVPFFIGLDPPRHDRMRRQVSRHFGPPHTPCLIQSLRPRLEGIVSTCLDAVQGHSSLDIVSQLAFTLPIQVVCDLLAMPLEDALRFRPQIDMVAESSEREFFDRHSPAELWTAHATLCAYFEPLVARRLQQPGPDLLSALLTDGGADGPMPPWEVVQTAILVLISGHETTVNLISNGVLTLLRHPHHIPRLVEDPEYLSGVIEELLRYEPPAQYRSRTAMEDLLLEDVRIPQGAEVVLLLAAANRDPRQFPDPHHFDPERPSNAHLGFGQGIHYCFGAALARVETEIALRHLFRRLKAPRLLDDPPPYRDSPALRGPATLKVAFEAVD